MASRGARGSGDEVRVAEGASMPASALEQIMAALKELKEEIKDVKKNVGALEEKFDVLINEGVEVVDGAYDAVFNAEWSYVVKSDEYDEKWLGMDTFCLIPGEQPQLWSEEQADMPYDPEKPWEGDVVPGVSGKLVMAVLSSEKGWPCMLFDEDEVQKRRVDSLTEYNAVCDAYIRRENLRVWHIVMRALDQWMNGVKSVHPFIVTGTPGIGKSFATGSLLLYQLLHYPSEDLKAVAYFVEGKAYIFYREEKRVARYKQGGTAANEIKGMIKRGMKGYIIFDMGENSVHMGDLPYDWGLVLIASPHMRKFHDFAKQRAGTTPIYMNCYEDAEFKAVLALKRRWQVATKQIKEEDVNLENDWKELKERIDRVGPVPRYVLAGEVIYKKRFEEVDGALRSMRKDELENYLTRYSSCQKEWYADETKNKVVKIVRIPESLPEQAWLVESVRTSEPEGEQTPDAESARCMESNNDVPGSSYQLSPLEFEKLGLKAFTMERVVNEMVNRLRYLPREGETELSRSSVLARVRARGRIPKEVCYFTNLADGEERNIESGCLYVPEARNFPVLDGFFLVEAQGKGPLLTGQYLSLNQTVVLLQVTLDESHETHFKTVAWFRRLISKSFTDWYKKEKFRNYELIWIQRAGTPTFGTRQGCRLGEDYNPDHPFDHPAFWDSFHQFRVELDDELIEMVKACRAEADASEEASEDE